MGRLWRLVSIAQHVDRIGIRKAGNNCLPYHPTDDVPGECCLCGGSLCPKSYLMQ
jgi:hypothetical protein